MRSAEHGFESQTVKEKQAAAKQTFVFQASLANEYPAKQEEECEARIREINRIKSKRLIRDEWPDRGE